MSAQHTQIPELCETGLQICAWLQSPTAAGMPEQAAQFQALGILYCLVLLDLTLDLLRELNNEGNADAPVHV